MAQSPLGPAPAAASTSSLRPPVIEPAGPPTDHLTQAERAARALAESERARKARLPLELSLLESTLDVGATLRAVLSAAVPGLADWAWIDLMDEDGVPRRVQVAFADPANADLAARLRQITPGPGWATPAAQAIRDRAPRLFRQPTDPVLEWFTHDPEHLAAIRNLSLNSLVAVPLVARDRAIGAMTLVRSTTLPPLGEEELLAAERLAGPAALAIDNARRFAAAEAAQRAAGEDAAAARRESAEAREAALRLRRLESLASSLAAPLDAAAAARLALENGLSVLGPSSGVVAVGEGGAPLEVLHAHGWPEALRREWPALPAEAPALVAEACRIQTAIWIDSPEALAAAYPSAVGQPPSLEGERAWAAAPLRVDGRTLGALSVSFAEPRRLDEGERAFVLAVAHLAAQAIERGRLRASR